MSKNQQFNAIKIESMTNLGAGSAHLPDGRVVFVKGGVTGDLADVKIIKETAAYSVAIVENIIESSAYRAVNTCPSYLRCGGCVFRHIDYELEKRVKEEHVKSCFKKYAGTDITPEPVKTFSADRYRNNVRFPLGKDKDGKIIAGFFSESSHRIVKVEKCLAQKECFDHVVASALDIFNLLSISVYDEISGKGYLRYLCLRCSRENDVSVCVVVNSDSVSGKLAAAAERISHIEGVCGVYVNFNARKTNVIFGENTQTLYEKKPLVETICGKRFNISPRSFFQVNTETAEMLYNKAAEYLDVKDGGVFVDLYCGTGTIGICAASNGSSLYGCDIIPEAIENAKQNARENGIDSFRYDCADASEGIRACINEFGRIDSLIVDPPRKGLSSETVRAIIQSGICRFVYISCNPDTLARDAAEFIKAGYRVDRAALYDLFPRTSHVETACLLSRSDMNS